MNSRMTELVLKIALEKNPDQKLALIEELKELLDQQAEALKSNPAQQAS